MQKKIVFLITSVVHFVPSPLSYSKTRSRFTPEERMNQTIQSMKSIRSKFPNAYIVLIELGTREARSKPFKSMADRYIYLGGKKIVRQAVDSPHKGLGEAIGLWLAHRYIQSLRADYFFKLSGRYRLNGQFHKEAWLKDGFSASKEKGWMSTKLYGFSKGYYTKWRMGLKKSMPELKRGIAIEKVLPRKLGRIRRMNNLGVSGTIAPWNKKVSE